MNAPLRRLLAVATAMATLGVTASASAEGPGTAPTVTNGEPTYGETVVLNGTVNHNGLDTTYNAECGADLEYGTSTEPQLMPFDAELLTVSIDLGPMPYGAQRHCRIVASNSSGNTLGDDILIAVPTVAPIIDEVVVAEFEGELVLQTSVNPGGLASHTKAWCGLTTDYGLVPDSKELEAGGDPQHVLLSLYALSPGATYHCKVKAWNEHGVTYSPDVTVEIAPTAPRLTMKEPVIGDTVKFTGKLDPAGADATTEISCVKADQVLSGSFSKTAGTTDIGFSLNMGTFDIGETYGCTATATNSVGSTIVEFPFKVSQRPPTAITKSLSFANGQMTVHGTVYTGGLATTAVAECGTTEGTYPLVSAPVALAAANVTTMMSATVSGVTHGDRYFCRIKATNDKGVSKALPLSLATPPAIGAVEARDSSVEKGYRMYLGATLATRSYVTTAVFRRVAGRMVDGKCKVAATTGTRCVALVYVGKVKVLRLKGNTLWAVPTVYGGAELPAGGYTAKVATTDPATGKVTGMRSVNFRVVA